ncbi:MAG: SDR family oxidoreductase [Kiloniellales bacterium]
MKGVLVVTGGGRGIGAATARLGSARGYAVCVNYVSDRASAERVVGEIATAGGRVFACRADVSKEAEVEALFSAVNRELGPATALVNNAGVAGRLGRLDQVDSETLRRVVETNLMGTLYCCRAAIRRMSRRHGGAGGTIVNLSSGAATIGSPNTYVWYAAAKGAINSLTLGLGKELASEGIRVNAVAPGYVETEIHAASGMPDRIAKEAHLVPIGRAARPEEIAESILWLLSDAASYVTASVLRVAGGR